MNNYYHKGPTFVIESLDILIVRYCTVLSLSWTVILQAAWQHRPISFKTVMRDTYCFFGYLTVPFSFLWLFNYAVWRQMSCEGDHLG
jgi:hypothetical protein